MHWRTVLELSGKSEEERLLLDSFVYPVLQQPAQVVRDFNPATFSSHYVRPAPGQHHVWR